MSSSCWCRKETWSLCLEPPLTATFVLSLLSLWSLDKLMEKHSLHVIIHVINDHRKRETCKAAVSCQEIQTFLSEKKKDSWPCHAWHFLFFSFQAATRFKKINIAINKTFGVACSLSSSSHPDQETRTTQTRDVSRKFIGMESNSCLVIWKGVIDWLLNTVLSESFERFDLMLIKYWKERSKMEKNEDDDTRVSLSVKYSVSPSTSLFEFLLFFQVVIYEEREG